MTEGYGSRIIDLVALSFAVTHTLTSEVGGPLGGCDRALLLSRW